MLASCRGISRARFVLLALLVFGGSSFAQPTSVASAPAFRLAAQCPPGFEQTASNTCAFRSLYQQYSSLRNSGVGGLKTALPAVRDGFTPQQIDLGRYLFFDPLLSKDGTVACASCHQPDKGFSDGRGRSIGVDGALAKRSAPSLWNVAFLQRLFWDGRAASLEAQMQGPLYDAHEMGNSREQLLKAINANSNYQQLFAQAFPVVAGQGGVQQPGLPASQKQMTAQKTGPEKNRAAQTVREPDSGIRLDQIYTALTAFESSLISLNSRYDHYAHGYAQALNAEEVAGLNVFRSFVARCAECHTPPLFTNQQIAVIGTPEPSGVAFDAGAGGLSGVASQRGGFRVPSLRNVARTAPYMHSGRFATLREAAEFYTKGRGHAVPASEQLTLHWHIWEPKLSDRELDQLVAFLGTLNDEQFLPVTPAALPSGLAPVLTATATLAVSGEQ